MRKPSAKFITLEGGDGAGKTTHIQYLTELFGELGIDFVLTREPGGTKLGERLRDIILNGSDLAMTDNTELLLVFAARMQHIEQVIRPALASGKWVLCDRFTDATFAYQGAGRGIDWQRIAWLRDFVQGDLQPHKTFILDVDLQVASARRDSRGEDSDRFESQDDRFKGRVRAAYQDIANREPQRVELINANAPIDVVQQDLKQRVMALID